ncbi:MULTISPECIES: restriction endonuclease subunit S [unclassified Sphingobium]|uniref:restriction endonuclease subunit S n=1 Tax=unclassified Sphingobium TaxID=2611147 RepID=UPI002225320D|nr:MULTISPECIES: restriction endonuclease subunit S [unclassified Sphingobium]MCW2411802.1 type I restriction enzyme S subunit [Sphingobium sp. B8D3D]MCW2415900.1 type I restriction enzyme S subunit [Sphingobium sp. B8D3A]
MKQPIDLRPDHAKIVHEIIARHLPAGVSVRVFGSRAKWTTKPHSDLDLALKGKEPLPRSVLGDLAEAFSESDLPFRVDVVDWHAVTPSFQAVIDRDGVALGWQVAPLEACLESLIDYRGKSPTKSATGIPVLSAKVVKTTGLIRPIEQTIAPEYYPKWMTRGLPKPGDVVMTTEAPMGEVIQLDAETARYALGQRIVCMRGKRGLLDNTFLRYLLTSPKQQDILASYATGTTVLGISQKALRSMPISFPAIEEQERIGTLLSALDDKIELNRQMNETLEGMAQAIFRDWFVDFGPVRRKAAGETDAVAIMGDLTLNSARAAQLAALFPDAFGDDGLPVGWEKRSLSDIATFTKGRSYKSSELQPSRVALVTLKSFARGGGYRHDGLKPYSGTFKADQIVSAGDIVLSQTDVTQAADIIGRPAIVSDKGEFETLVASLDVAIIRAKKPTMVPREYLFQILNSQRFTDHALAHTTGTTVLHLAKVALPSFEVFVPVNEIPQLYNEICAPFRQKIHALDLENAALSEARDYLLPRLMSGTVRVARESEAA